MMQIVRKSTKYQTSKIYLMFDLNGKFFQCCLLDVMLILRQINFTLLSMRVSYSIYFSADQKKCCNISDRIVSHESAGNINPNKITTQDYTFDDLMFKREQRKICYMCQHFYRMHLRASELNIRRGILDLVKSASIFVAKTKYNRNRFYRQWVSC